MKTICLTATSYTATNVTKTTERAVDWSAKAGMALTNSGGSDRANEHWAETWTPVIYKPGYLSTEGKTLKVPTSEDYFSLESVCQFGFGIVYGDGAESVATDIEKAYRFKDIDNDGIGDGEDGGSMGVRACVAYNPVNGDNILFPMGSTGQGRRACFPGTGGSGTQPAGYQNFDSPGAGTLSYGGLLGLLISEANRYRPLTYDIYRNPGVVYWIEKPVGVDYSVTGTSTDAMAKKYNDSYAAWDINYFNVRFDHYDWGALWYYHARNRGDWDRKTTSDAFPIKLIYKN